ncbi:unnamed protein product, partial [Prorocentrum cordatum]
PFWLQRRAPRRAPPCWPPARLALVMGGRNALAALAARSRLTALALAAWAAGEGGGFDLDYSRAGEDWEALCHSGMQSPIDVEPDHVKDGDVQARVLYKPWSLEDIEVAEPFGKVPRLEFKPGRSPGLLVLGTRYGDLDEYQLTSVEVHAPSEHTFRQATWPVELQLWHVPVPLARIGKLERRIAELVEKSGEFDDKLQSMAKADQDMLQELAGTSSPWETAEGREAADSVKQTLDWVDASKAELEAQASELRQHTFEQMEMADALAQEVDGIVLAQERELANHHVVISLFVRRAASAVHGDASSHEIVEWVTEALVRGGNQSGAGGSALDARGLLAETVGRRPLISYPGSLNRPPCTPNVRWLLTDRPIVARLEHIEELIRATLLRDPDGGFMDDGLIGDSRETQSSENRRLERVRLFSAEFEEPVIVEESLLAAESQKWIRIARYSKLFCACSFAILLTPCLFIFFRACGFSEQQGASPGAE